MPDEKRSPHTHTHTAARPRTGFPSIDKPWLKYYSEEAINAPLPECSIYEYLWENNKDYPDDIALIYFDRRITYRELFESIDRVARAFAGIGVREGDVVTLLMLNQPETVYCLYALSKLGAVACFINVLSSVQEIEHYLAEGKSRYFVALDAFFEKSHAAAKNHGVEKLVYVPLFESRDVLHRVLYRTKVKKPKAADAFVLSWRDFLKKATAAPLPKVTRKPSDCAVIGHTGGTTGVPKGVKLTDNGYNAIPAQYGRIVEHERQGAFFALIIPHATYGLVANIHLPLSLGMKVILIPKVDLEHIDELIMQYQPNYIASIPLYWNPVLGSEKIKNLSFLKWASRGGAGFSQERIDEFDRFFADKGALVKLLTGYGMTEVCALACTQMNWNAVPQSVGFPLPYNIIAAFDVNTKKELPYNEVGEICIHSPSTMLGYLDNEEETKNVLRTHDDGLVWMHTGDLGCVDENGNVFIKGRLKRIYLTEYNAAHAKIFPDRIERTLLECAELSDCGVVCLPAENNAYRPVAFCVRKGGCGRSASEVETELRALCQKELPEYDLPVRYYFVDALPRTAHGKIDYLALEKEAELPR